MAIKIVEADVRKDIDVFVDILNRNRTEKVRGERFEWLYLKNPYGEAKAWFVIDEKNSKPVAFTSVLPRMVKVENKEIICWNCCDFSVDKKYRTLGVAIKLRHKAKECVDNGEIPALYAHPNDKMKVVHEKVGHYNIGKMNRYAKLLYLNKQIKRLVKSGFIADLISPVANWVFNLLDVSISTKSDKKYSIELLDNMEFSSEYDELFQEVSRNYRIIGDRSSTYLNWRYVQNPLYHTKRITIRKDGKLAGYIIFLIEDNIAVFKDILCVSDNNTLNTLLTRWIKKMKEQRVNSISAILMDKNPMIRFFQNIGFALRPDESTVYAYAGDGGGIKKEWINGDNWYMTVGDRDV